MTSPVAALAEPLLDRWLSDAAQLAPDAGRDLWLAEGSLLLRGWSEPHRSYHTAEHLAETLAAVDELEEAGEVDADEALVVRGVLWYHDLVYDPRAAAGSNEHRSAMMARDHLHRLGVHTATVEVIEAGVLMTFGHEVPSRAATPRVLDAVHDADLWILGAPVERYAAYRRQVRREYAHVPDPDFARGRAAIMGPFLHRERLYRTSHAHLAWTDRARANLAAELADLSTDPGAPPDGV
ncbi:HD domain-containing protein [Ornithinimicrobium sufpigmenti]|uniref:HD domain-containing protein n=1 Tax=Ornithinimicrobium sufpigmenti TaxID=2508882 RepID=UPI001036EA0C|nr:MULTISPECIES: metal-dependent phosphohydrolase [unclassified Ornithinimicrobium]